MGGNKLISSSQPAPSLRTRKWFGNGLPGRILRLCAVCYHMVKHFVARIPPIHTMVGF